MIKLTYVIWIFYMLSNDCSLCLDILKEGILALFAGRKSKLYVAIINFLEAYEAWKKFLSSLKCRWLFCVKNDFRAINLKILFNFFVPDLKRRIMILLLWTKIKLAILCRVVPIVKKLDNSFFDNHGFLFFRSFQELLGHFDLDVEQWKIIIF